MRNAVRALWTNAWGLQDFVESLRRTVNKGYTQAWTEGAMEVGIPPGEWTIDEQQALLREIGKDWQYITRYGIAILEDGKAAGGKLSTAMNRAELWVNRYNAVKHMAKVMAGKDKKMRWTMHPLKEHCRSCAALEGRVKRASYWAQHIKPQDPRLECGGWRCGCNLVVTTDAASKGRLPGGF